MISILEYEFVMSRYNSSMSRYITVMPENDVKIK